MNSKRVFAIMLRQLYLIRRNPSRLIPHLLWPMLDVVMWGFLSKYLSDASGSALYIGIFLGAVLLLDFFTRSMQGITTAFFEDVWSKNFLNLFSSPLSLAEYVLGLTSVSIVSTLVTFGVLLFAASLFFHFSFISLGLPVLAFLAVMFLIGIAFGIFAVGMVLRLGPSAEWFVWPIPAILTPFVGVYYPIATLPGWMQTIAHVLPLSYVFENLRSLINHGRFSATDLSFAALLSVIYIALAYAFLRYIFRLALRTGLLARYSAENSGL